MSLPNKIERERLYAEGLEARKKAYETEKQAKAQAEALALTARFMKLSDAAGKIAKELEGLIIAAIRRGENSAEVRLAHEGYTVHWNDDLTATADSNIGHFAGHPDYAFEKVNLDCGYQDVGFDADGGSYDRGWRNRSLPGLKVTWT